MKFILKKHDVPVSAIPCMAFQKRKEIVEKQIREHNQAKQLAKSSSSWSNLAKCPISNAKSNPVVESMSAPNLGDSKVVGTEANVSGEKSALTTPDLSKVVVSIQSNEEKQNENNLSNLLINLK